MYIWASIDYLYSMTTTRLFCLRVHCDCLLETIKNCSQLNGYHQREYVNLPRNAPTTTVSRLKPSDEDHGSGVLAHQYIC